MFDYTLIRSKRKTVSLSVSKDLKTIVRAPIKMPVKDIECFIAKHTDWIEKQKLRMQELSEGRHILSDEEIKALKDKAKNYLPHRVEHFADIMGVKPKGIKITSATTRWGSCSAKNSLCFPYRLMLLPDKLIDYIIVHELAHIKEKNHSTRFYSVVEEYLPNYRELLFKLKELQLSLPQ